MYFVCRSRFLPVKKSSDLLLIMSNLYSLSNGALKMSPDRMFQTTPLIKLGDQNFKKVNEFLQRFGSIPGTINTFDVGKCVTLTDCPSFLFADIIELDHLTVSGDVTFGKGVVLKGTVIIIANQVKKAWINLDFIELHLIFNQYSTPFPGRQDRHPAGRHPREQDRLWQPQDPRPLKRAGAGRSETKVCKTMF